MGLEMGTLPFEADMTKKTLMDDEKISKYEVVLSGVPVSLSLLFLWRTQKRER